MLPAACLFSTLRSHRRCRPVRFRARVCVRATFLFSTLAETEGRRTHQKRLRRRHGRRRRHSGGALPSCLAVLTHIAQYVKALWADAAVQKAYMRRSEFQLIDSANLCVCLTVCLCPLRDAARASFFSQIDRLSTADYMPTERDALTVRARTTGIIEVCARA